MATNYRILQVIGTDQFSCELTLSTMDLDPLTSTPLTDEVLGKLCNLVRLFNFYKENFFSSKFSNSYN